MREGQSFGELGLIQGKPWLATVITTEPSILGAIDREVFKDLVEPALYVEVKQKVSFFKQLFEGEVGGDIFYGVSVFF